MELKPGTKMVSAVCDTEVVVVRAPSGDVDLRCGGVPMTAAGAAGSDAALDPQFASGTLIGKRYVDDDGMLEVLCSKAGAGSLAVGTTRLEQRSAKPLPSSD